MLKHSDPHSSAKAIVAFLILVIGLAIVALFKQNRDMLMGDGSFNTFFVLVVIGLGLLLGLFHLVNDSHPAKSAARSKSSKRRKSR